MISENLAQNTLVTSTVGAAVVPTLEFRLRPSWCFTFLSNLLNDVDGHFTCTVCTAAAEEQRGGRSLLRITEGAFAMSLRWSHQAYVHHIKIQYVLYLFHNFFHVHTHISIYLYIYIYIYSFSTSAFFSFSR